MKSLKLKSDTQPRFSKAVYILLIATFIFVVINGLFHVFIISQQYQLVLDAGNGIYSSLAIDNVVNADKDFKTVPGDDFKVLRHYTSSDNNVLVRNDADDIAKKHDDYRVQERQYTFSDSNVVRDDGDDIAKHKNVIQLENELPGSSDWVLSKPAVDREIEGYMSRTSVNKGQSISLFYNVKREGSISTQSPPNVTIDVYRTGWYGGVGGRKVLGSIEIPGIYQTMPNPETDGLIVCRWRDPYVIETNSWTTGVYLVKMTEMKSFAQSYAIFVVRDDKMRNRDEKGADIMFQLPVNTYQAYNRWGSKNLYGCFNSWGGKNMTEYGRCSKAFKVSFDRPYAQPWNSSAALGLGAGEYLANVQLSKTYPIKYSASWNYNMVRWLEKNNLDVTYVTNVDTHTRLKDLAKPKLFLSQGHDEYWSWAMRDHVTDWRDQGVHLAFLGSNTAYWQIRYEDMTSNDVESGEPRTIVCYRRQRRDPVKDKYRSTKWRQVRPEALLVGVEYIFPLGDPFDEDIIVSNHSHWLFNGTGVKRGDKIPGILGYEVDRIANIKSMDGNTEENIPADRITKIFETPLINCRNETIIAQSGFYTSNSGAHVFASGTMQWSWGLDDYGVQQGLRTSRLSKVIERMTWNLLNAAGIRNDRSNVKQVTSLNDRVEKVENITAENLEKAPNMEGWIYEPKNLNYFWKKMGDRPFQAEFYSQLDKFGRILDIGVRGYNRYCKAMINSTSTQYFQIDPFPPKPSEMNNDGIFECYVQELKQKFPHLQESFDLVIDFGVFGWESVMKGLGDSGIREYVDSIYFVLKKDACWALKIDTKGWCDSYNVTQEEFFDKYILPHFHIGNFSDYQSPHSVKRGKFVFYWLYKKDELDKTTSK